MHILIIPSEPYITEKSPLGGIFEHSQAKALIRKGYEIGIISAGFIGLKNSFSAYPYGAYEFVQGMNIYRCYRKSFFPWRYGNRILYRNLVKMYIQLFDRYVLENDIPNIIHAHNCLWAGVAAMMIKKKYNIPYVITEHSSSYSQGRINKWQVPIIREVLKNAAIK